MALTNAERQARHRARLQDKLRNASPIDSLRNDDSGFSEGVTRGINTIAAMLHKAYFGQADTFRKAIEGDHVKDEVEGAIAEFLAEEVKLGDLIKMVEMSAYGRIGEFFNLHCLGSDLEVRKPEWVRHSEQISEKSVT